MKKLKTQGNEAKRFAKQLLSDVIKALACVIAISSPSTLDLIEFNVNVMTGNNGAHQRSPYDPGIQN